MKSLLCYVSFVSKMTRKEHIIITNKAVTSPLRVAATITKQGMKILPVLRLQLTLGSLAYSIIFPSKAKKEE